MNMLDDLPSPPGIPINPQQMLEDFLFPNLPMPPAHFHDDGQYALHFDIPEADLEFELEEMSRPNEH